METVNVARTSLRALRQLTGVVARPLTAEKQAEADLKRDQIALVVAHGCGDCCGEQSLNEDGSRLKCALLEWNLTPAQKERCLDCQVPELYAAAHDGLRTDITAAEVEATVPKFEHVDAPPEAPEGTGLVLTAGRPAAASVAEAQAAAEKAQQLQQKLDTAAGEAMPLPGVKVKKIAPAPDAPSPDAAAKVEEPAPPGE